MTLALKITADLINDFEILRFASILGTALALDIIKQSQTIIEVSLVFFQTSSRGIGS